MSDPQRSDLHDPKYGKVRELCKVLGYASDRKGTPRSMHTLSLKATAFRKKFIESTHGICFPLAYESVEAQSCASSFLSRHARFFEDSMDAQAFGWPVLPRDLESLRDNLAKLMCIQEYVYRRNMSYAESREKKDREEIEGSTLDESDSELSDDFEVPFNPTASRGAAGTEKPATSERVNQSKAEREAMQNELIRENIRIHLSTTYPLDGTKDGKSSRWLFNSEKCPEDIKPFVWRYFHERDLYAARKSNVGDVVLFAQSMKRHLNIICTNAEDMVIQRRCQRIISGTARLWSIVGGYGFLAEVDGVPKKTAQFEGTWRDYRNKWIESVHNGNTTGVIELDRSRTAITEGSEPSAGRKRAHGQAESTTNTSPSGESISSAGKRHKPASFKGTSNASHTANEETSNFAADRGLDGTRSIEGERVGVPKRAPEAPATTPVPNLPKTTSNAVPSKSNRSHPYSPSPSPSFHPDGSSARSTATLDHGLNMPPPSEKRSTPYALKGASLNVSFDADTALIKSAQMVPPGKPKLRYILQNSRGVLDYDSPLSNEIFRTYSISEFFNVVASRAGKPDGSLTCLTFVFNWGEREAFVINRYGGEQYWEDVKERVKGTFLDARNSMKKRAKFELWIKCGDTTNLDDVEEDEDW